MLVPSDNSSNTDAFNRNIVVRPNQAPERNAHQITLPPIRDVLNYALKLPIQKPEPVRIPLPVLKFSIPPNLGSYPESVSSVMAHESPNIIQDFEKRVLTPKTNCLQKTRQWKGHRNRKGVPDISYGYTIECQWNRCTDGSAKVINLEELVDHLGHYHGLSQSKSTKVESTCAWTGCMKKMNKGSLIRHVMNVHFMRKVRVAENSKKGNDKVSTQSSFGKQVTSS